MGAKNVTDFLRGWLDLIRQVAAAQVWLSLTLLVSFTDWYLLAFWDVSLLRLLAQDPQRWLSVLGGEGATPGVTDAAALVAGAVLAWFFGLPLLEFVWRYAVQEVALRWPDLIEFRWPSSKKGWRHVDELTERAALDGNGVLMAWCDMQRQSQAQRQGVARCLLGVAAFQVLAVFVSSPDSGVSLGLEALMVFDGLPPWKALLWFTLGLLLVVGMFTVLLRHALSFDGYVRLRSFDVERCRPARGRCKSGPAAGA